MRPADPRCRRRLIGYDDIAAVRQTKLTDNGETAPMSASGGDLPPFFLPNETEKLGSK
jgi:hypothetical protein